MSLQHFLEQACYYFLTRHFNMPGRLITDGTMTTFMVSVLSEFQCDPVLKAYVFALRINPLITMSKNNAFNIYRIPVCCDASVPACDDAVWQWLWVVWRCWHSEFSCWHWVAPSNEASQEHHQAVVLWCFCGLLLYAGNSDLCWELQRQDEWSFPHWDDFPGFPQGHDGLWQWQRHRLRLRPDSDWPVILAKSILNYFNYLYNLYHSIFNQVIINHKWNKDLAVSVTTLSLSTIHSAAGTQPTPFSADN